jgi:cell wall-associated NlpC family hydrolase
MWAAKSGKYITYSQDGRRWSGITQKACPYQSVPSVTDCSAFVTWLYWSAFGNGKDFLNNQGWKAGYTGSMGSNGTPVSLAQARPGDVVLYGSHPYHHATLYVGNNQVVSFGANGPAKLLPINYRGDYHVRSYLP